MAGFFIMHRTFSSRQLLGENFQKEQFRKSTRTEQIDINKYNIHINVQYNIVNIEITTQLQ